MDGRTDGRTRQYTVQLVCKVIPCVATQGPSLHVTFRSNSPGHQLRYTPGHCIPTVVCFIARAIIGHLPRHCAEMDVNNVTAQVANTQRRSV
jgi:hypothetical protein